MAVYVDRTSQLFGRMKMCHMLADTLEELHAMADKIGMKRSWFQPRSTPHYDVCISRRKLALENGAKEIGPHETVEIIRKWREVRNQARLQPHS